MTWLTLQHFCLMFLACHSQEAEVPTPTRWPSTLVLIRAEWQSSSWVSGTWQRWMRRHRSLPTCPSKTQQLSTIRSTSLLLSTNRALLIVEPHGQTLEKLNKTCISLGSKPLVGPMCMMDQLFLPALWSPRSRTSTLLELVGSMLQLKRLFLLSSCFIMFHHVSSFITLLVHSKPILLRWRFYNAFICISCWPGTAVWYLLLGTWQCCRHSGLGTTKYHATELCGHRCGFHCIACWRLKLPVIHLLYSTYYIVPISTYE